MNRIIKAALTASVLVSAAASQMLMRNGLLFRALSRSTLKQYDKDLAQQHQKHTLNPNVSETTGEGYTRFSHISEKDVIINIHGGGLMMGVKEFNRYYCANLCEVSGCEVYAVEYPLVPKATIYEQLQVVADEINDICTEGGFHRIYLTGDSAGALLCLYTAALQKDEEMQRAFGVEPIKAEILGMGLMSGMFYTTEMDTIGIFMRHQVYGNLYSFTDVKKYADPSYLLSRAKIPPCFLISSKGDYLSSYTTRFADAMKDAGQECELCFFDDEDLPHAFPVFEPDHPATIASIRRMLDYWKIDKNVK